MTYNVLSWMLSFYVTTDKETLSKFYPPHPIPQNFALGTRVDSPR